MQLFVCPRVSYCLIFSDTSFFFIYRWPIIPQNDLTSWKTPLTNTKQAFVLCFVLLLSVYFSHGDIPFGALCSPAVSGRLDPWAGGTALLRGLFNLHGNLFVFLCARYSMSCAPCLSLSGFTSLLKWDVSPSNFWERTHVRYNFKIFHILKHLGSTHLLMVCINEEFQMKLFFFRIVMVLLDYILLSSITIEKFWPFEFIPLFFSYKYWGSFFSL